MGQGEEMDVGTHPNSEPTFSCLGSDGKDNYGNAAVGVGETADCVRQVAALQGVPKVYTHLNS